MGKTALTAGAKPGLDIFGLARRVDLRLVAPWSSWEDRESQRPDSDYLGAASPPTSLSDDQRVGPSSPPVRPSSSIVGPSSSIVPRELHPRNERWRELVDTISPQELGARD
jgi:hypothetical protein